MGGPGLGPTGPQEQDEWAGATAEGWVQAARQRVRSRLVTTALVALTAAFTGALVWDALGIDLL